MTSQTNSSNPTYLAPTLADVAKRAGVSTATVSRCLNSPGQVVEATRERVLAAVQELGYAPNFNARALAAKRSYTVGAVLPTMENAIFARGIQAFQEELHDLGFTLLVASSLYKSDVEEEQIRTLVARGADALLLIGYHRDAKVYRFLEKRGVPVIIAWAHHDGAAQASVGFDNKIAMETLARTAIEQGHRRIACITAEQANNDRARDRVVGIRAAMASSGLNPDDLALVETTYSIDRGAEAMTQLMQRPARPTLVMCGNDVLAVGALSAAKALGLDVPQEVSITGFDDIELATVVDPPLSTVHVPHRDMGRRAAQALVKLIKQETQPEAIKLDTHLCLRGTLAAPRQD